MLLALLACTDPGTPEKPAPVEDTGGADTGPHDTATTPGDGTIGADDARFDDVRTAIRQALRTNLASGASAAILLDGELVWAEGFGTKSPDDDEPVTPHTLFNIGSDTKKLTAIALLREVEAGRVSLDETLADALPALTFAKESEWSSEITVRDLLSHESALYDDTNWTVAADDDALAAYTYGDFATNEYVMARPGMMWNYANPNFSLAGLIVEEVEGRPYADVLADDVLAPLGMDRSTARVADVIADGDYAEGNGYYPVGDAILSGTATIDTFPDSAWVRPAGGVWSTATEMLASARFLMDGDAAVLDDALRADMSTEQVPLYPDVEGFSYGDGLFVYDGYSLTDGFHRTPTWLHGGNHLAYTSTYYVIPEAGFALSILSNGYGDDFTGAIVAAAEDLLTVPAEDSPDYDVDPATYPEFVGTYSDPYLVGDIVVAQDGESLSVAMPQMEELGYNVGTTLDPVLPGVFVVTIDGVSYDLTFVKDETGARRWARNRAFVGERGANGLAAACTHATREEIDRALATARMEPFAYPR